MTPKEKAQELYFKMLNWQDETEIYLKRGIVNISAKQCALITVHEIIIEITDNYDSLHAIEQALYWQQVKTEIEKYEG